MEQVLRASNDGVLVYVAPTKALVTQVAAEIYARFSKDVKNGETRPFLQQSGGPDLRQALCGRSTPVTIASMIPRGVRSW